MVIHGGKITCGAAFGHRDIGDDFVLLLCFHTAKRNGKHKHDKERGKPQGRQRTAEHAARQKRDQQAQGNQA